VDCELGIVLKLVMVMTGVVVVMIVMVVDEVD
jgi:hypothetical protein